MRILPTKREMWQACLDRDSAYDNVFVLAVRTTGVFCRPSCTARNPNRENVEFFDCPPSAVSAGYRACKRCHPMEGRPESTPPEWVQELLDTVQAAPDRRLTDTDLRAMSLDPVRVRRYFKRNYGMTFQAYHRSLRLGSALAHLRDGSDLTSVGYRHGFESSSGFRDAFERLFGTSPGRGRQRECIVVRWVDTTIGPFIAGATDEGLCLFEYADRRALETQLKAIRDHFGVGAVPGVNEHIEQTITQIGEYFDGSRRQFDLSLILHGTEFQEKVWRQLLEIPYGATMSYEQMAQAIGRPGAQRAVGTANGRNPMAVIIPCHRVVRNDGTLGGYGGGLWRKQLLLDHEQNIATQRLEFDEPSMRNGRRVSEITRAG